MPRSEKWITGRYAMLGSLAVLHVWGTVLVVSDTMGRSSQVTSDMFSAVMFGIFSTLGLLVGGKGWKDFAAMRWGGKADVGKDT